MQLQGISKFISTRQGVSKKTDNPYFAVKCLDENAEEFFWCYVDEQLYAQVEKLKKNTEIVLTVNLVPGQTFFTVESIDASK